MDYKGRIDADSILNSAFITERVRVTTDAVAARARAYAPKGKTLQLSGAITTQIVHHAGVKNDRTIGIVSTNAHAEDGSGYGAAEEFGTSFGRGNYFLRRAAGIA